MTEKVAIVTGGGSGIGRAVSQALLGRGYRVAVLGRNQDSLAETIAEASPKNTMAIVCDVRSSAAVTDAVAQVVDAWGRIDLLFNNAGTFGPAAAFEELEAAQVDDVVATNLLGAIYMAQAVYAQMVRQVPSGGRIINNGSISAHAPRPHSALYTSTKHALTGLTKSLALDGRVHGIACGQIDIGNAATALTAAIGTGALQPNGERLREPTMDLSNVVNAVLLMAEMPAQANVPFMTVMATTMPFIGRG